MGCVPLHIGSQLIDSSCCESLSQKSKIFASSHRPGAFLRPVSFHCAIPGFFKLSIDSVGKIDPQTPQTQTGAGASDYHPEPKRRVNLPMVPPGGFSRGG